MKIKAIYIAGIALLASCSDDVTAPTYTVGEADNAIVLRAGISEGSTGVATRAGAEEHHTTPGHKTFTIGTKAALRIDGTWLGHAPVAISQTTTATIGDIAANTNGKHNDLTMSPQRYWDDYGTADPNNMPTGKGGNVSDGSDGRSKGLTIYGAAVNGVTTAPVIDGTSGKQWTALTWNVGDGSSGTLDQTEGWSTVDLLTSNNVKVGGPDGTYKFDERNDGKLLEFTHAMTKVTVELTAGAGFADAKFVNKPKVTLLDFNYTGTVNVEAKTSTATTATTTDIKAHLAEVKETSVAEWSEAPATWASSHKAKYDALVFPGNSFTATIAAEEPHTPTSTTDILKIDADGNIYTVTAAQLVKAIVGSATGEQTGTLEQAKNYILKITVNKTGIDVTATIKDWVDVAAANEAPVINIDQAYGHTGTDFAKSFDFYRSSAVSGSYLTGITDGNHVVVNYVPEAGSDPVIPAHYELETPMYWPDHDTHYFFRGIWPVVNSTEGPAEAKVKANSIEVENVAYQTGHYPSDLMIGIPRKENGDYDETCKVAGHAKSSGANGICATEGKIRMNFQYAMSQVIVNLTTSTGDNKVVFDGNTKVEIIGGYTTGEIKLSDESSDFTGKTVTDYTMNREGGSNTLYHDAIIPQSLQDGEGNATLKFRITVKTGETYDTYETVLGIKDIKVTENEVPKNITAWEPGKKYTYTLNITKTGISVTATLKDWITVTADEPIWF